MKIATVLLKIVKKLRFWGNGGVFSFENVVV
jgi:hypothetical protein